MNAIATQNLENRHPQPETWNQELRMRDGTDSGAYVEMWSKDPRNKSEWEKVKGRYETLTCP